MGDLEEVDGRQPARDELGIDALLHVAREQEPVAGDLAEQDDGDVVDRRPAVGRAFGHAQRIGPEDGEVDAVDGQPVAGREPAAEGFAGGQDIGPRPVPRTRSEHPGLVHPADGVALQEQREAGDVILVGMGEHEDVDAAVPWRQALVEGDQEAPRIRPAIDDHAAAAAALDEDPVTLSDVEDDDARDAVRAMRDDQDEADRRRHEADRRDARRAGLIRAPASRPRLGCRQAGALGSVAAAHQRHEAIAPPRDPRDEHEGRDRAHCVPRCRQLEAGQRQAGTHANHADHRAIQGPSRQADEHREEPWQAEAGQDADNEGERARRHGRRDERHHDQVDRGRHEREPPELEEHDGRRRRLRCEGHAEDLREPAPRPARLRAAEAGGQRCAPRDDPRRREDGQAESRIVDPCRVEDEQHGHRPPECRRGRAGPAQLPREERHARHCAGSNDGRRWPHEQHVQADREGREDGAATPLHAPGDCGQR